MIPEEYEYLFAARGARSDKAFSFPVRYSGREGSFFVSASFALFNVRCATITVKGAGSTFGAYQFYTPFGWRNWRPESGKDVSVSGEISEQVLAPSGIFRLQWLDDGVEPQSGAIVGWVVIETI